MDKIETMEQQILNGLGFGYGHILEKGEVKKVPLLQSIHWKIDYPKESIIAKTRIGETLLSTVFLGALAAIGNECLFETMVFDAPSEFETNSWHYRNIHSAEKHHRRLVRRLVQILQSPAVEIKP